MHFKERSNAATDLVLAGRIQAETSKPFHRFQTLSSVSQKDLAKRWDPQVDSKMKRWYFPMAESSRNHVKRQLQRKRLRFTGSLHTCCIERTMDRHKMRLPVGGVSRQSAIDRDVPQSG